MKYSLRSLMIVVTLGCVVFGFPMLILTVFLSLEVLPRLLTRDVEQRPFDSTAWKRADEIENHRTVRSQMVDQLIGSGRLDGLKQTEVENLLGPPLRDMNAAGVDGQRWNMAYYLGLERSGSWSIDDEFLVIRFDPQGRVAEYRIVPN
jgi:hypothetical protein